MAQTDSSIGNSMRTFGSRLKRAWTLGPVLLFIGCSSSHPSSSVTILLPARDASKAVAPTSKLALGAVTTTPVTAPTPASTPSPSTATNPAASPAPVSQWGLNDPTSANDFVCYLVTADAAPTPTSTMHTITNLDKSLVTSFGVYVGLAAAGSSVTLNVPSGPKRTISVYGFVALNSSDCATLPATLIRQRFSAPFLMGAATQDLTNANETVTINVTWANVQKFESSDLITVIDTPVPAALSAAVYDPQSGSAVLTNSSSVKLSILGDTMASRWCVVEQSSLQVAPSLPSADSSCWVNTRPSLASLSALGPRAIYVFTEDSSENFFQSIAPAQIDYEIPATTTLATLVLNLQDYTTQSTNYLLKTEGQVEISGDQAATKWCLSSVSSGTGVSVNAACAAGTGWLTTRPTSFTVPAGDGTKIVYLWTMDSFGNVSIGTPATVILDTVPPLITAQPVGATVTGISPVSFLLTFSEAVQNVSATNVVAINGTISSITGTGLSRTVSVTPFMSGQIGLQIAPNSIFDLAGNSNTSPVSATVTYDSTPPVVMFTSPTNLKSISNPSVVVSGTCESGLPVTLSGPGLVSGQTLTCSSGLFSMAITLTSGDGTKNLLATQVDAAGNPGSAPLSLILDTTPPTLNFAPAVLQSQTTSTSTVVFSGNCENGLAVFVAGADTSSITCSAGTWTYTTVAQSAAGTYSYQFMQTDLAGNSTSIVGTWVKSPPAPMVSIASVSTGEFGEASIPVTLSTSYSSPITVGYSLAGGSAVSGVDFTTPNSNSVTFAAGQTLAYIQVPIRTIDTVGTSRSFNITLNTPNVGTVGTGNATVTIQDNMAGAVVLSGFSQVSAGQNHVCALKTNTVYCWGSNQYGQLGNGTTNLNPDPTLVTGIPGAVTQISSGGNFTCALTTSGSIYCWGVLSGPVPTVVSGITNAVSMTTGLVHGCAVLSTGAVMCWGNNSSGELGNGTSVTPATQMTAVNVSGLGSGVVQAYSGPMAQSTCAVTSGAAIYCWGASSFGLGNSAATTLSTTPVLHQLSGFGVLMIALGQTHSCLVQSAGSVYCWGSNGYGELGNMSTTGSNQPVAASALGTARAITLGNNHTCVLNNANVVQCLGLNSTGQLGNSQITNSLSLVTNTGLNSSMISSISAGANFTCAVDETMSGTIGCWGLNSYGETGQGFSGDFSLVPVNVASLSSISSISLGSGFVLAQNSTGNVYGWGRNSYGELGNGATTAPAGPLVVPALGASFIQISSGTEFSCGVTAAGAVNCWGYGFYGQLGNSATTNSMTPVQVTGLTSGVIQVAVGGQHACALVSGGSVMCWGNNANGQLGIGSTTGSNSPHAISGLSGVISISAGLSHTCALLTNGNVECWGDNANSQIGDGTATDRTSPTLIAGLTGIIQLAAGGAQTCALASSGTVQCWGLIGGPVPTQISGFSNSDLPVKITAGQVHACAVTAGGAAYCWGSNLSGQVGNGMSSTASPTTIYPVKGLPSGVSQIVSGSSASETCAISQQGYLYCWGDNTNGALGFGRSDILPQATMVVGF